MPVELGYFPSIFALTASQNGERAGSVASPVPCLFLLPSLFSSHLLPFFSCFLYSLSVIFLKQRRVGPAWLAVSALALHQSDSSLKATRNLYHHQRCLH